MSNRVLDGNLKTKALKHTWKYLLSFIVIACFAWFIKSISVLGVSSKTSYIVVNLKQLDGAKKQWAFDHHETGAVLLAESFLSEYLGRNSIEGIFEKPRFGERYRLMPLGISPEAELTSELEGRPMGTILRLATNGSLEVIPPNPSK